MTSHPAGSTHPPLSTCLLVLQCWKDYNSEPKGSNSLPLRRCHSGVHPDQILPATEMRERRIKDGKINRKAGSEEEGEMFQEFLSLCQAEVSISQPDSASHPQAK